MLCVSAAAAGTTSALPDSTCLTSWFLVSISPGKPGEYPYHLVSVALLTGPGDGMDTPTYHINGPFCLSDEEAVPAFLKAD